MNKEYQHRHACTELHYEVPIIRCTTGPIFPKLDSFYPKHNQLMIAQRWFKAIRTKQREHLEELLNDKGHLKHVIIA